MMIDGSCNEHARQGHQLPLAQREAAPALAHSVSPGPPAARPASRRRRSAGRHRHLVIGRFRAGIADVVGDGAGEQEGHLRHDAELAAIGVQVRADVVPVDQELPALELIEAGDQLAQRRLARAGVPDQRHGLAGADVKREMVQHRLLRIAEADVAEVDLAFQVPGSAAARWRHAGWRRSGRRRARAADSPS